MNEAQKVRNYYVDDKLNRDWLCLLPQLKELEGSKEGRRVNQDKLSLIERIKKEFNDLRLQLEALFRWGNYEDKKEQHTEQELLEECMETKQAKYQVQGFHSDFGKDETGAWSFSAEDGNAILDKGGWSLYKQIHLVTDTSEQATPERKAAYTYPVAKLVNGKPTYFLKAAQSVYQGLRGGTREADLPQATNEKVLGTVKKIYDAFGRETEEMALKKRPDESYEDFTSRVRRQFSAIFDSWTPNDEVVKSRAWADSIYDNYLYAEKDGDLYRVEFTDEGENITFQPENEWQAVKRVVTYEPVEATKAGSFITHEGRVVFVGGPGSGGGTAGGSVMPGLGSGNDKVVPGVGTAEFEVDVEKLTPEQQRHYERGIYTEDEAAKLTGQYDDYVRAVSNELTDDQVTVLKGLAEMGSTYKPQSEEELRVIENAFQSGVLSFNVEGYYVNELGNDILQLSGSEKKIMTKAFAFKTLDGETWWFQWTSNAFVDREHEIFTTKALSDYVKRHQEEATKGEFWYRHIPGTKFGTVRWQAMVGRFLAQAGPFDNTPVGQAFKAFFEQYPRRHKEIAPFGWGTSHGFFYNAQDRKNGTFEWLEIKESTTLPVHLASNVWSPAPQLVRRSKAMNEQEKKDLLAIGGKELVDLVIAQGEQTTKELETLGIAHKQMSSETAERFLAVITMVEDEAVRTELQNIYDELYGEMEYEEEAMPEEDTLAEEELKAAKSPPVVSREEIAAAIKAAIEPVQQQLTTNTEQMSQALQLLTKEITKLKETDSKKFQEKVEQTPAASLVEMVTSLRGRKEADIPEGDPLLEQQPKQAEPRTQQQVPGLIGSWMGQR